MEVVAGNYLRTGDVASASSLYNSLENLHPKYSRMARICRVLCSPGSVPLPHRHNDICEALLDPLVLPEMLLGDGASPESVNKKCQRLIVHVHPDKNPNPQAKEAFLRLRSLKEEALKRLEKRMAEEAVSQEARNTAVEERLNRKRGKGKGRGTAAPVPPSEDKIQTNLTELKKNRITLTCLKRKDIADDFEIFSSTHRSRRRKAGMDIDEDEPLASTVPQRARKNHQYRRGLPVVQRSAKGPITTASSKMKVDTRHVEEEEAASEDEEEEDEEFDEEDCTASPLSPLGEEKEVSDESIGLTQSGSQVVSDHQHCSDDMQGIRMQIDSMIANLGDMKTKNTAIRLKCDLSFDAYLREKNQGSTSK